VIYVVRRIGSGGDSTEMPSELVEAILQELGDLTASVEFVEDQQQVIGPASSGNEVLNGGVVITLGPIGWEDENTILADGSLYKSNLGATGRTYRLQRVDGVWQVVGDTGTVWIS